ncbi:MAG: phasin family protein [Rhodoblastus sp.]
MAVRKPAVPAKAPAAPTKTSVPAKAPAPAAKPAPVAAKAPAAKPAPAPAKAPAPAAKPVAQKAAAPVMDMSEAQENLRNAASKTIQQGREAFDRMKEAGEDATHTIEASLAASSKGAAELAAKALEVARINANSTFDHLKALAGVKTIAEAVTMHGQFIRTQSEAAIAQAKEFAELAKKAATDAGAPIQAQIKKAQAK